MVPRYESLRDAYESKVVRKGPDECWGWIGYTGSKGYVTFNFQRKTYLAHRVAYELFVGPIPEGVTVSQTCGNRVCTNPAHLRLGKRSGRSRQDDESFTQAKLTEDQVREIAEALRQGETQVEIAARYEVDAATIHGIAAGKTWRNVTGGKVVPRRRGTLSEDQVREMRALRAEGVSYREIAERMGLPLTSVFAVASGRAYKDVQ